MKHIAITIALALASTSCIAAAMRNQLRAEAGAHTGCPAERVEIVGEVKSSVARVRVCGVAHLCHKGGGMITGDMLTQAMTATWACAPADESSWVDVASAGRDD